MSSEDANAAPACTEAATTTHRTEKPGDEADALNSAVSLDQRQVTDCARLVVDLVRLQLEQIVHAVPLDLTEMKWVELAVNWTAPTLPYAIRLEAVRLIEEEEGRK